MANTIITKNSSTASAVPTAGDLVQGELAVNVTDKRLFTEDAGGNIVEIGTNPSTINIDAGTIDGTAIGGTTPTTGAFTTLSASTSLTAATADINGGTIDGTTIGGTTAAAGAFTTLSASGAVTLSGNTTLGDASTDTVTVNGYMGVGGAPSAANALWVRSNELTGTGQAGTRSEITGTSAATSYVAGAVFSASTAAASFTTTNAFQLFVNNSTKGAGSTITNQHGLYIADQTQGTNNYGITSLVSSGTNKWNIYASGTAANYFAGNVGIGVAPDKKFTLVDGATYFKIYQDTTNEMMLTVGASERMLFGVDGSEKMRINSSGHVGIGTSSPDTLLSLGVSDVDRLGFDLDSGSSLATIGTYNYDLAFDASGGAGRTLIFKTGTTAFSGTERLRINLNEAVFNDPGNDYDFRVESDTNTHALFLRGSDGNVGIGTSSPDGNLTIGNTATSGDLSIRIKGDATSRGFIMFGDTGGVQLGDIMYDHSTNHMRFRVNDAERLLIDSSGYLRLSSNSGGIQFNGDTAAANALDDYEEGTWTPTNAGDATGTINAVGTYVKIGRSVTVSGSIVVTANFTGADFGGLPYQPDHIASYSSIHGIYNAYSSSTRYVSVNRLSSLITVRSSLSGTLAPPTTSDGTFRFTFTYQTV